MSLVQLNAVCPALLLSYKEANSVNNIAQLVDPVGFLDGLHDPANIAATKQEVLGLDGERGHVKQVRIWRKQRQVVDDTATTKSCPGAGTEKTPFEDVITPSYYREITIKVSESAIRKLCDQYSTLKIVPGANISDVNGASKLQLMAEIWDEIGIDFNAIRRAINIDLLTAASANYGKWVGGASSKTFPVYRSVDAAAGSVGSPVLDGFNKFVQEIKRSTYNGKPIVVGEGLFDLANMSLQFGCCNNGGTDFGKMNENAIYSFYRDVDIVTGTGSADGIFAFMPGAVQFVSYNEYVGSFARPIGTVARGTIPDPFTPGLTYDMRVFVDECGENYSIVLGLHFDLYAAPNNLFKTGDRLVGVNGFFKALATGI